MATNNKEYMREYQRARRWSRRGFDLELAKKTFSKLLDLGVGMADASWAIMDACRRGCFDRCR